MRTVSIGTMVKQLEGMLGTRDLSIWERGFVDSVVEQTRDGTTNLSDKQVTVVERIWQKHFA